MDTVQRKENKENTDLEKISIRVSVLLGLMSKLEEEEEKQETLAADYFKSWKDKNEEVD